jgi:DNA-binding transcriptional ArsR family regulator
VLVTEAARPDPDVRRPISDPTAIRALAHPTRLALLEILAGEGQATATRCAELSGQSVASCSFHLRTLARHGFVEAVPGPGREKPWRLTSLRQEVSDDSGAAGTAFDEFFLGHEFARIRSWLQRRGEEPEAWRRASFMSGATAWLTPEELAEIGAEIGALIERRFVERVRSGAAEPGRQPVRLFVASSVGLFDPTD